MGNLAACQSGCGTLPLKINYLVAVLVLPPTFDPKTPISLFFSEVAFSSWASLRLGQLLPQRLYQAIYGTFILDCFHALLPNSLNFSTLSSNSHLLIEQALTHSPEMYSLLD